MYLEEQEHLAHVLYSLMKLMHLPHRETTSNIKVI